jgi:hypothetical protein
MRYAFTGSPSEGAIVEAGEKPAQTKASSFSSNVVVVLLVDIAPSARLWGYSRFVLSRFSLRSTLGLKFFKMLGSGDSGGFGLKPSASKQGLFCVFENDDLADTFLNDSELVKKYQASANEFLVMKLLPYSSKGKWAGNRLEVATHVPVSMPIAALTRASIRPSKAREFWKKQPAAEISLNDAQGCLLATGVGEAPYFRQATISLWESPHAMDAYARTGAHLEAIKASMQGKYFSESMFVRFVPTLIKGVYNGKVFS